MVQKNNRTPISYANGTSGLAHMIKVDAKIAGQNTKFIFDTGIGVNLISKSLCSKLKCKIEGSVTGKRMTGQSVTIPMSKLSELVVAGKKELNVDVGVLDFNGFLPKTIEFKGVQGYLSLNFFKTQPFTIDYEKNLLIFESSETLAKRVEGAETIPIFKKKEGLALTIQIPVKTQISKVLKMQLDLGTNIMTINNKYLKNLKPYFDDSTVKTESIVDETGFKRSRTYVSLEGEVGPESKTVIAQRNPTVMFQDIIYDGIIGNDFFKGRIVTYDLENSRLLLKK